jgi:hypothetical protein
VNDPLLAQMQADAARDEAEYNKLQKEIERLSKPTPEVLAAQEEENRLIAAEQGVNAELNQKVVDVEGEPIPQGFQTGWGNTFNKQANAKLGTIAAQKVPLQLKLANLQAQRAAAMDVVKSKQIVIGSKASKSSDRAYDYQMDEKKRKQQLEDKAMDKRYITVGDGAQVYDTQTGQIVSNNPKNFAPKSTSTSNSQYTAAQKKTFINTGESKLNQSRGTDGYVDPAVYEQAYMEWTKNIGTTSEFLSKFPPKLYVNPENKNLPIMLRNTTKASSTQTP